MIIWSAEYNTGISMIDEDHRRLIDSLNQLENALSNGTGSKQVPALLDFLESYASQHFAREEACMTRHACPTAAANKAAHQEFIVKFGNARSRLQNSTSAGALVAVQVHRELCDWIVRHILSVDSAIKRCPPPLKHRP